MLSRENTNILTICTVHTVDPTKAERGMKETTIQLEQKLTSLTNVAADSFFFPPPFTSADATSFLQTIAEVTQT